MRKGEKDTPRILGLIIRWHFAGEEEVKIKRQTLKTAEGKKKRKRIKKRRRAHQTTKKGDADDQKNLFKSGWRNTTAGSGRKRTATLRLTNNLESRLKS